MAQHPYQNQPPNLDLNNLDEDFELRFDYDNNGNLTRIRKVRRNEGCLSAVSILLVLAGALWLLFN
jgi:hypothetical protein